MKEAPTALLSFVELKTSTLIGSRFRSILVS